MRTYKIVNGDRVIDRRTGQPVMVEGPTKFSQDILRSLSIAKTAQGEGTGLDDLLGQDVDPNAFRMEVTRSVRSAMTALQRLQDKRAAWRSGSERLLTVTALTVTPLTGDSGRTDYALRLKVQPVSGSTTNIALTLTS